MSGKMWLGTYIALLLWGYGLISVSDSSKSILVYLGISFVIGLIGISNNKV